MAKKKQVKPKEIKVILPKHPGDHDPEDVVIVPTAWVAAESIEPLPGPTGPTRCVLTVCEPFWSQQYIVLAAAPGHSLPESLKTGQEVDVQFSPPK